MATGMFSGGAAFGNPNLARQVARTRELQAARSYDVNTLPDPQTYAFAQGFLGEAPDQLGFSPMHPDYAKIMGRGGQGMVTGGVSLIGPTAQAVKGLAGIGARALGPTAVGMGERYLQRQGLMPNVVPKNPNAPENIGKLAKIKNSPMVKLYHSSPYKNIDEVGFNAETQLERGDKRGIFFSTYPQEDYGEFVYEVLVPRKAITWDTLGGKKEKLTDAFVKPEYSNLIQFSKKEHGVENYLIDNAPSPYPQQTALDLAQQRAALPIEQGGLGLPVGNTAEQRAAAQYGKDMVHFSRAGGDYTTLDSGKFAIAPFDAVGTHVGTPQAAMERYENTVGYKVNNPNYANDELKGATYPVTILGDRPMMNQNGMPWGEDDLNNFLRQQGGHNWSDIQGGKMTYQDMNAKLRKKLFEEQGYTSIPYYNEVEGKGSISYIVPPDNIRSRFAAYDPFRRNAAIAAAMGVAAPNLMAGQDNEMPDAVRQYMADPRYSDPFADTTR